MKRPMLCMLGSLVTLVSGTTLLTAFSRPANVPPTIVCDAGLVWEAHAGQEIVLDLLDCASDDRDDPAELTWSVEPKTLEHAEVSRADPQTLIFTPLSSDFTGDDEITLVVQDQDGAASMFNMTLRWTPEPNVLPFINPPIPDFRAGVNQPLVVDLRLYGHDADGNDEDLGWTVTFVDSEAPNPTVSGEGSQVLTFTPAADFEGAIEAEFIVHDPDGGEAAQAVRLTWQQYRIFVPWVRRTAGP